MNINHIHVHTSRQNTSIFVVVTSNDVKRHSIIAGWLKKRFDHFTVRLVVREILQLQLIVKTTVNVTRVNKLKSICLLKLQVERIRAKMFAIVMPVRRRSTLTFNHILVVKIRNLYTFRWVSYLISVNARKIDYCDVIVAGDWNDRHVCDHRLRAHEASITTSFTASATAGERF